MDGCMYLSKLQFQNSQNDLKITKITFREKKSRWIYM